MCSFVSLFPLLKTLIFYRRGVGFHAVAHFATRTSILRAARVCLVFACMQHVGGYSQLLGALAERSEAQGQAALAAVDAAAARRRAATATGSTGGGQGMAPAGGPEIKFSLTAADVEEIQAAAAEAQGKS
jgi:hypothetical protein